jgi:hypothetical protein
MREENSVLFSLKELRKLEDERCHEEEQQELARLEAERRRLLEEAEARRAAEAALRAEEERRQREQYEREQKERERELAERAREQRVVFEQQLMLEQARAEAEARAAAELRPHSRWSWLPAVVVIVAVTVGACMWLVRAGDQKALRDRLAQEARQEAERRAILRSEDEARRRVEREMADLKARLEATAAHPVVVPAHPAPLTHPVVRSKRVATANKSEAGKKAPAVPATEDPLGFLNSL